MSPEPVADSGPGLMKSAGIVSLGVMTSRITGLVRESVLSWLFGASATYDAYVLAYRIPSLARELFAARFEVGRFPHGEALRVSGSHKKHHKRKCK